MAGIDLLCIGNVMVDVFAEAAGDFCKRFGFTAPVQHVSPELAGMALRLLPKTVYSSGGGAANTAKTAARLGLKTAFAGCAGRAGNISAPAGPCVSGGGGGMDGLGRIFRRELEEAGVETFLCTLGKTGCCLILKNPEEDPGIRIAAAPGSPLDPASVPEDLFRKARFFMLDGYMLGRQDLRPFIEKARSLSLQKYFALDAGSAAVVNGRAGDIAALLRDYGLILFMNREEAAALRRRLEAPEPSGSSKGLFRFLQKLCASPSGPVIVLKLAGRGAAVCTRDGVYTAETRALKIEDSTGAGDAFAAGFLSALFRYGGLWGEGRPGPETWESCARAGNAAAALILSGPEKGNQPRP
ncbi:MAG: PfkB family carbohydrate kinase [Treponema sp.]|jgi:fructokinase|nr:PfkB family carbohydrate kinase [Treponema sp.]